MVTTRTKGVTIIMDTNLRTSTDNIPLDLEQTESVKCSDCDSTIFQQITKLQKVSALVSPTGEPSLVPVQGFMCIKCNRELKFNTKGEQE